MNIALILKYIVVAAIFIILGLVEGTITNPPPSQETVEYQQDYDAQASKGSLTQSEFEALKNKENEFVNSLSNENQLDYIFSAKLSFALLLLFSAFAACKYIFNKATIVQVGFTCAVCIASLLLFTSTFELIVYMSFCVTGALIGKKYNKSSNLTGANNAPSS